MLSSTASTRLQCGCAALRRTHSRLGLRGYFILLNIAANLYVRVRLRLPKRQDGETARRRCKSGANVPKKGRGEGRHGAWLPARNRDAAHGLRHGPAPWWGHAGRAVMSRRVVGALRCKRSPVPSSPPRWEGGGSGSNSGRHSRPPTPRLPQATPTRPRRASSPPRRTPPSCPTKTWPCPRRSRLRRRWPRRPTARAWPPPPP